MRAGPLAESTLLGRDLVCADLLGRESCISRTERVGAHEVVLLVNPDTLE